MRRIVLLLVLVCLCVSGTVDAQKSQIKQLLRISGFGGLNTRSGVFSIPNNEFRAIHNVDLSRSFRSISKRRGFETYLSIAGIDSIFGIKNIQYSNGEQELIFATDPDSLGVAHLMSVADASVSRIDTLALKKSGTFYFFKGFQQIRTILTGNYGASLTFDTLADISIGLLASKYKDSLNLLTGIVVTVDTSNSTVDSTSLIIITYDTVNSSQAVLTFTNNTSNLSIQSNIVNKTPTTTKIYSYLSPQSPPSFAVLQDKVWIANGRQRGLVWNREVMREFPLPAPSIPSIIPINIHPTAVSDTSTFYLDGQYRYIFRGKQFKNGVSATFRSSPVSSPIKVDSGRVLLTRFSQLQADSVNNESDSTWIFIYRTKANPGAISTADSAFLIDSVRGADFSGIEIIDSLPDDQIPITASAIVPFLGANKDLLGRDSTGALFRRVGAPSYLSSELSDSAYDTTYADTAKIGPFLGWPVRQRDTLGVAYMVTLMDTVNGVESDSGRTLVVWQNCCGAGDTLLMQKITIGMPPIPDGETGLVFNIYRAPLLTASHDTAFWSFYEPVPPETTFGSQGEILVFQPTDPRTNFNVGGPFGFPPDNPPTIGSGLSENIYIETIIADSLLPLGIPPGEWRLLAQIPSTDTLFTDSLRQDSLEARIHRIYRKIDPPKLLDKLFSLDGRLWGVSGSRLYYSSIDAPAKWGAFQDVALNINDGDDIQATYPVRSSIRTFKKYSNYNVFQNSNLEWQRVEVSGYYGIVAPLSHAATARGHYFLSNDGILREKESGTLERVYSSNFVSAKLDNFERMTDIQRASIVAFPYKNKVYFSSPHLDTTYVYDEIVDGWTTAGFSFGGATLRRDSMLFFSQDRIYVNGLSEYDDGLRIAPAVRSGAILASPNYKTITDVGLWVDGSSDTSTSYYLILYDEEGNQLGNSYEYFDLSKRYFKKGIASNATALYFQWVLGTNPWYNLDSTAIDGIDIWYTTGTEKVSE